MRTYKKFVYYLLAVPLCFLIFNAVTWKLVTEELLSNKTSEGGDLARMGYLPDSKSLRKNSFDLPRGHLEDTDYKGEPVDVVTIGDSFTNGGGGGRNRYYQDYIASNNDMSVLNIEPYLELDFITLASYYANNGYLDKIKPRHLIISYSEKFCIDRLSSKIDLDKSMPMDKIATLKRVGYRPGSSAGEKVNHFAFINDGNFKFLLYKIYYRFSDHAFFSKTYKKTLNAPLFSAKDSNTLLFYRDDLKNIGLATPTAIARMNDYLNLLADKLAAKGIRLYFMPCVDKYNLYSEFIVNNRYPQSTFFEQLRPLPKRYTFIDTKALLLPEVRKGVQDIYYADDTHWSWKASAKIFDAVRFD